MMYTSCVSAVFLKTWTVLIVIEMTSAKEPPRIVGSYQMRHLVRSGDTIRLNCPVESDPSPLITWQKDGEMIHVGWDRFRVNENGHFMRVKDLEPADSGVFVCRATNGFGTIDVRYLIYVYDANDTVLPANDFEEDIFDSLPGREDPPQFSSSHQMTSHISQFAGSVLRLTCKSSGTPKPKVAWFKNGMAMQQQQQLAVDGEEGQERWLLRVVDLKESDSGRYTCRVFNKAGAINFTYTVDIADRIAGHPENISVQYGESASFLCHVQSEAVPRVQWLKKLEADDNIDGRNNNTVTIKGQTYLVFHGNVTISRKDGTFLSKLTIPSARSRDAGMYVCSTSSTNQVFSFRAAFLTILPSAGPYDTADRFDTDFLFNAALLPVILAAVAVVGVISLAVVVFVICRRRHKSPNHRSSPPDTASSAAAIGGREAPDRRLNPPPAPGSSSAGSNHAPLLHDTDRQYHEHQYAALQNSNQPGKHGSGQMFSPVVCNLPHGLLEGIAARGHPAGIYTDYSSIAKPPGLVTSSNVQFTPQQLHYHHHQQQQQQQHLQHPQLYFYENC